MTEWDAETAEWYAEKYGEYATNLLAVEALDLPSSANVVDVGCGTGSALRHAANRLRGGHLIGVDPVPRMIQIAMERLQGHPEAKRIEFREGSAEAMPVEDGSADLVFAFDSMDHWQDLARGLSEVKRVLRRGGQLIVVKDSGVPGADKARRSASIALKDAGFVSLERREISAEGVSFTLWRFAVPGHATRSGATVDV